MNAKLMKSLGSVMQLAYVPADFDATLEHWINRMGVGPFFKLEHAQQALDSANYLGRPCTADLTMAIGYWGDMQVELIQQHNDAPSIYKAWRDQGMEGVHHICIMVDDLDKALKHCADAGATLLQDGRFGPTTFAYVDTRGGHGTMLEMLCAAPPIREYQAFMKECARTWDGSNPVRPFGP